MRIAHWRNPQLTQLDRNALFMELFKRLPPDAEAKRDAAVHPMLIYPTFNSFRYPARSLPRSLCGEGNMKRLTESSKMHGVFRFGLLLSSGRYLRTGYRSYHRKAESWFWRHMPPLTRECKSIRQFCAIYLDLEDMTSLLIFCNYVVSSCGRISEQARLTHATCMLLI